MQKSLGNLFRSIAEVIDNGTTENEAVTTAVAAPAYPADALTADAGMSDSAVEDGIIDLIDSGEFTHRKATTLAEKLEVDVVQVKKVAEESEDLFIYTKRSNGETMIRLS